MMHPDVQEMLLRQRQKELLREAEHRHMVKEALAARALAQPRQPWFARVRQWLNERVIHREPEILAVQQTADCEDAPAGLPC